MDDMIEARPPRARRIAIAICAVFGVILASGIVVRMARGREVRQWTVDNDVPTVAIIQADRKPLEQTLVLPGILRAFNDAQLYARVPGYVKSWKYDIGARVRQGDALAVIDTPELDQQIMQAEADLESARSARSLSKITAERWSALLPLDAVSQQAAQEKTEDLAAKSSAVKAAEANLARLHTMKTFARIVAPFDGVVTARNVDIGTLVSGGPGSAGQALFSVSDVHELRVYVQVPQSFSAEVSDGSQVSLTVPELTGRKFPLRLLSTSNAINPQSGTLLVELATDNPDAALKPGGYGQVTFALRAAHQTLAVPASALIFRSGGLQVAVVNASGHVALKTVSVARDLGPQVEISSGLSADDRIIDDPPDSLAAGDPVHIARDPAGGA